MSGDPPVTRMERAMLDTYFRELASELEDPKRLRAVYGSDFYDAEVQLKLNSICATAAQLLNAPHASVNLIERDTQRTVATYGSRSLSSVEASKSVCQHTVGTRREINIDDFAQHPLVCELTTVHDGIRSYLGVPLMTQDSLVLGALCVWDTTPRTWNTTHVSALASLASVVMRFHHAGPAGTIQPVAGESHRQG